MKKKLRDVLQYDAESGNFYWKVTISNRAKKGTKAGTINDAGYVIICYEGKDYRAHRIAWYFAYGAWPKEEIDHIDGDPSNNRITNLREVNRQENSQNTKVHKDSKSGIIGVCWDESHKKWKATLSTVLLGRFDTLEEAVTARRAAESAGGYHPNHGRKDNKKKRNRKMVLFYSGSTNGGSLPEEFLREKNDGQGADIMLTFYEIYDIRGDCKTRLFRHIKRRAKEYADRTGNSPETTGDSGTGDKHKGDH